MQRRSLLVAFVATVLAACGSVPPTVRTSREASARGHEVTIFALSLLDTNYRFGGKNPEAGLDCSGMVAYVFERAAGLRVAGSAAEIARQGRPVERAALVPGDLVFFNTASGPLAQVAHISHVGIYIGDGRFVHAPSSASGKVRIDQMANPYFAPRFTTARAYFD